MSRHSALLALFLAAAPRAVAQDPSARVEGTVIEAFSGRLLAGATARAAGASAETGADGRFVLVVPAGAWTLEWSAAGHTTESVAFSVTAGETRRLDGYLLDRSRLQEQVEVRAEAGSGGGDAALPVRAADVLAVAGAAENVFRTLQTLPGVAAAEEFGSRISVRGGGPDQNLTLMDGVEVHNPFRLFGLTSAFNPETVRRFELFTGAFSAKYGDRLSSLLLVENRDGVSGAGWNGSISLGLTDANVVLEGGLPGTAKGSWLVTGRRTYYDLVAERFDDSDLPSFADLQGRLAWEARPGQRLTLIGLRGREATDATFESEPAGEQGDFVTAADNDLVSLQYDAALGKSGSSRTIAAWYRNTETLDVDTRFRNESKRSNAPGSGEESFAFSQVVFTRELAVRDLSLRQELSLALSNRQLVETGIELHRLRTGVAWKIDGERNPSAARGSSVRGGASLPADLESERDAFRFGAFAQHRWQMMRGLVLQPGLRFDYAGSNGRGSFSPRFTATLGSSATRARAAVGLFTQSPGYEKLAQADDFFDLSEAKRLELRHERALHLVLGLERDVRPGLLLRAEAFYKRFGDLIAGRLETEAERRARVTSYDFPRELLDQIPSEPQITTTPVNQGAGRAYGLDAYVARRASSPDTRVTGWASYTWTLAERDAYGRRYPFDYDRRHAFSLVAAWRASRKLDLAVTARAASGFPRTPVAGVRVAAKPDSGDGDGDGNTVELVPERDANGLLVWIEDRGGISDLNSARLPSFARVDARVSFRPRGPAGRWLFYLDVVNLLNRDNTGAYEAKLAYDPGADRPRFTETPSRGVPLLPSLGVRFRF